MRQRLSISRLMMTIALLGLSLGLLKSWAVPKNCFGVLGLMTWMVFNFGIAWFVTTGLARRFFAGALLTCSLLLVLVLIFPFEMLNFSWNRVMLAAAPSFDGYPPLIFERFQWLGALQSSFQRRDPSGGIWSWLNFRASCLQGPRYHKLQILLLIPHAFLSVFGGLIATLTHSKSNRLKECSAT